METMTGSRYQPPRLLAVSNYLEIQVIETIRTGGLKITFANPVAAAGMYVMGLEDGKRVVDITLTLANGDVVDGHDSSMGGAVNRSSWCRRRRDCLPIHGDPMVSYHGSSLEVMEFDADDTAADRDIFSVDDIAFSTDAPNQLSLKNAQ